MKNILFAMIGGFLFLLSCNKDSSHIEYTLSLAGTNRIELEKVIAYYSKNKADSLKLKAAIFLIENMPGHKSHVGNKSENYHKDIESILLSAMEPIKQRDSVLILTKLNGDLQNELVEDAKIITSDFLIKNIEDAFNLWKTKPWVAHLNFEEFCEYILPYKCFEPQQLENWRDSLSVKFGDTLSLMLYNDVEYDSPFNVAKIVRRDIERKIKPLGLYAYNWHPFFSTELLSKMTFGKCTDYVNLAVATMRSMGIPVVIDGTPQWGRYRAGHDWYTLLNDKGELLPAEWDVTTDPGKVFFPHERIPKIFRQTYAINRQIEEYNKETLYPYYLNVFRKDVTDRYFVTSDIDIPIIRNDIKDKYAYIAVFNGKDTDWNIIDIGIVKGKSVEFKNMGRNILYIVLGFDGNKLIPMSHPFILHKNGDIEFCIADNTLFQDVILTRKYHKKENVVNMEHRILGGKIQASNTPDFSSHKTLYTIEDINYPDLIRIDANKLYRYWRFVGADSSYCNIAELQFYQDGKTERFIGKIIGSLGVTGKEGKNAFDNDWLTHFETQAPNGAWIGMDFGKPVKIDRIRCVYRSDDNNVRSGDEYELMYWTSEGWKSLGIQTAENKYIIYKSVPISALLWLKNHTRGWDERVFLYRDGKQIWW